MLRPPPPRGAFSPLPSPSPSCAPSFISSRSQRSDAGYSNTDESFFESSRSSWSSDSDSEEEEEIEWASNSGSRFDDDGDIDDWWDDADWPPDFDGTGLFQRLLAAELATPVDGHDPPSLTLFRFDVRDVLDEVEAVTGASVVDIPLVTKGANYFGMHLVLHDDRNILARIARLDVNWLTSDGDDDDDGVVAQVQQQVTEVEFEDAVYRLLAQHPDVRAADLLYCRPPAYRRGSGSMPARDAQGRALFVFVKAEGRNNVWPEEQDQRLQLLEECARIRGSLFSLALPDDFIRTWITRRPPCTSAAFFADDVQVAPSRDFALAFLNAKLDESIPDERDSFPDGTFVGPAALRAKGFLQELIPLVLPTDEDDQLGLYRFVLEHGDFGIHNLSIVDGPESSLVKSVYDWESGHIVPALLSNPQLSIYVDLQLDENGKPTISRPWEGMSMAERAEQVQYSEHYFRILDEREPRYLAALKAGKDARHIWDALVSWQDSADEHEVYFARLGDWAEEQLLRLSCSSCCN